MHPEGATLLDLLFRAMTLLCLALEVIDISLEKLGLIFFRKAYAEACVRMFQSTGFRILGLGKVQAPTKENIGNYLGPYSTQEAAQSLRSKAQ